MGLAEPSVRILRTGKRRTGALAKQPHRPKESRWRPVWLLCWESPADNAHSRKPLEGIEFRSGAVAHACNPSTLGGQGVSTIENTSLLNFGKPRQVDWLSSGVQDQPGQRGETPPLLKYKKLASAGITGVHHCGQLKRFWPGTVPHTCNPALWDVEAGRSQGQEFETSLANMHFEKPKWVDHLWEAKEAEAGESLKPGRQRLQEAKMAPLHSSLGNKNQEIPRRSSPTVASAAVSAGAAV
ncbi:Zinc finger protein 714 [Plecturocebus cupreus]